MLALLIGGLVAIACLAVVSLPFFRRTPTDKADGAGADVRSWAVLELKALETERAVGEITDQEFQARRQELRLRAARALRDSAQAAQAEALLEDDFLEAEVRAFRRARASLPVCPQCHNALPAQAAACPHCGAAITATPPSSRPTPHA